MPADRSRLERALNPRTVAVVGDKGPNFQWLTNQKEFTGQVWSVQLDEKEIVGIEERGFTNFKSLLEVPGEIDLVICAVPRNVAPYIMSDAIKKRVGGISMFTSGFAETGEPQAIELQERIRQMALDDGMPLVGPNCMGIYNRRLGVKFTADVQQGDGGEVSVISQSGTHAIGITMGLQALGVKVSRGVSFGNAIVLNECDYLEYLLEDEHTRVIAMYLEGTKDGRRLAQLLRQARGRKPVVLWRGGLTKAGERAIRSHTASLASSKEVWQGLMRQAGVIQTSSADETIDTVAALVNNPPSSKRKLALVAMTGGQSVAISDQFERAGFEVPELSPRSYERLAEFVIVVGGSYRNPFDVGSTVGSDLENLERLLDILAEEEAIDGGAAVELRTQQRAEQAEYLDKALDLLVRFRERTGKPLIVLTPSAGVMGTGGDAALKARDAIVARGLAVFPSFQRGAEALGRVVNYYAAIEEE